MIGPISAVRGLETPLGDVPHPVQVRSLLETLRARFEKARHQNKADAMEARPTLPEPPRTGIRFRPIGNPRVVQARVADRRTEEVLREVPTTAHLRFARAFRRVIASLVGHRLDARA